MATPELEVIASAGTMIWTEPDSALSVPPLLEMTPPSITVIVAVALFPSTAAVIVADPGATPATTPALDTVALVPSDVLQEKVRCNNSPEALFAVAASWMVAAGTSVAVSDANATDATTGGGGGPTTLSAPPPQEPMSQLRVSGPDKR